MFRFVESDDGDWYIIPVDKLRDYVKYLDALESFWEDYDEDGAEPAPPDWLIKIKDGPEQVVFPSYEIK